jgi:hypothetical protein|tara:strand:+ start:71 stop:310 length:240 start_codon:yes stop_codon:yes gene_type:complete
MLELSSEIGEKVVHLAATEAGSFAGRWAGRFSPSDSGAFVADTLKTMNTVAAGVLSEITTVLTKVIEEERKSDSEADTT